MTIMVLKFMKSFGPTQMDNPISIFGRNVNEMVEEDPNSMKVFWLEISQALMFSFLVMYFLWATHHGNSTVGKRHALFTFY